MKDEENIKLLQNELQKIFPFCDKISKLGKEGFKPHMTMGKVKNSELEETLKTLKNNLKFPFQIKVDQFQFCFKLKNEPYYVRETILLDKNATIQFQSVPF